MDFIIEWIKAEANAWFWIVVGCALLFGLALLSDGIDSAVNKLWGIKDESR